MQRGPLPEYAAVAQVYNQRVAPLERLQSTATVRIWYPNEEGRRETEQAEADLQVVRPFKVLLSLSKVGETAAFLGSNDEQYWWIELGKEKRAMVGEHAKVTPARVAELGLPVHPLDLLEMMAITPLPTSWAAVGAGEAPTMQWSQDGKKLVVTTLGRYGWRRLWLDPKSFQPSRIDLIAGEGRAVVSAELEAFVSVQSRNADGQVVVGAMPTRILASADGGRTSVRLTLYEPRAGANPKPAAFDFNKLIEAYRVQEVVSVDAPRAAK